MTVQFHPIEPSRRDAELILPLLLPLLPQVTSVVDFGCNNGQWLEQFIRRGVTDVVGVDGGGMRESLRFDPVRFREHDLCLPLHLGRRFDLALCVEVAEHLPHRSASNLLDTVVEHADTVVFSAASPGQGGYKHLNEQPYSYWERRFMDRGYAGDTRIRERLKPVRGIAWWLVNNLGIFKRVT